jgi:hypothetical protein
MRGRAEHPAPGLDRRLRLVPAVVEARFALQPEAQSAADAGDASNEPSRSVTNRHEVLDLTHPSR